MASIRNQKLINQSKYLALSDGIYTILAPFLQGTWCKWIPESGPLFVFVYTNATTITQALSPRVVNNTIRQSHVILEELSHESLQLINVSMSTGMCICWHILQ